MKYLECRYDRSGFGTWIKAQIKTNLYDYYIIFDGFDTSSMEPDKIIYRDKFLCDKIKELNRDDTVVITCNDLEGLPNIEASNCKKILTLHDITPLKAEYLTQLQKVKWKNRVKKAVEVCDYIVTVSHFSKKDIQKEFNISEDKIFVVYSYAQNVSEILNLDDVQQLKKIDKIYNAKYVISTVASMNLNKNFIRTALAWKKSGYYNISVLIAMSKKDSIPFRLLLALLGIKKNVYVPGYVPLERLASLYAISDLFIFPTLREGFGVPPLEAMALGVPVLTSNTSCMEEILGGEMAAIYINPYKVEEISKGIRRLLVDRVLVTNLIENGRTRSKEYSPARFYMEMLHVFEVCDNNSG